MYLVNCWIEHSNLKVNKTFSYINDFYIEKGIRVRVNFNRKDVIGFVDDCIKIADLEKLEENLGYSLKYINCIVDEKSVLTEELFELGKWLSNQTLTPTISCFKTMLPKKIKPVSNSGNAVKIKVVKSNDFNEKLTLKQQKAYDFLKSNENITLNEFRNIFKSVVKSLLEKNAIEIYEVEKENSVKLKNYNMSDDLILTKEQKNAFDNILKSENNIVLLNGVTGSGKTEIYLQLAREIINQNKQVLFLVPEISLTPQMVQRVKSRFFNDVAIYHSGLNDQEKYEEYKKVLNNKVKIVIGTRSAIFMPFSNLGLIIMDEEHDLSYKQDNTPQYHCRDIAIKRAENFGCKVLLGSATPSLESYARALKGVYKLVEINSRINNKMPKIKTVNITKEMKNNKNYIISEVLKEKIQDRLNNNKQVILLLNRRGFNTFSRCQNCNNVIMCPHCDISMSYHKDIKMLKCHICNTTMPYPKVCPKCNSVDSYSSFGFGTQRLEEEVKNIFKNAKVLRMDADTTSKKNSHEHILESFSKHEADILLGTQMISKGLDYPSVTLVGILNADAGLNRIDYRSQEIIYDILTQASGRSGRSDEEGEVIIQVFDEDNYVIKSVLKQDYKTFFNREMMYRKAGGYPPYNYLISVVFSGRKKEVINNEAYNFKEKLIGNFNILGPSELLKINDQYRFRIILKGKNLDEMRENIQKLLNENTFMCSLKIDVNPLVLD